MLGMLEEGEKGRVKRGRERERESERVRMKCAHT